MRFLLAIFLLFVSQAYAEDELLEPEAAFRFSAEAVDANTVAAHFQVAKGYYLYKNKIHFSADGGVKLGTAVMPKPKIKQDEAFGKVETYTGDVLVRVPVTHPPGQPSQPGKTKPFNFTAKFQGCAEVGVCYQPLTGTATIKAMDIKAITSKPTASAPKKAAPQSVVKSPEKAEPLPMQQQDSGVLARLKGLATNLTGPDEPAFLPPDQAFQVALSARPDGSLAAEFNIAKDHYLYRDKVKLNILEPTGVSISRLDMPKADEKNDPNFGKSFVYHQSFTAVAKLAGVPTATRQLKVLATYQGCSEKGICYPPEEKTLMVDLSAPVTAPPAPVATPAAGTDTSDTGRVQALLKGGSFWVNIVSFFGFGLLLAMTPCVFPMIPILSGIIVGQGGVITKRKGFLLSLAYVLGMALTYAMAGVAAGLSGTLISNALQNPWALGTGAGIFVALALSMFGFYELQMPSFLQSRFTEASNRVQGGRYTSVFIMGAISALIVGPCVAAPLAGALLYISQTGDVVLGGVSLFALALGMGLPLLLVGLSAGALLPRAGGWMDAVKRFFGVMLLAVAIWLISPLLTDVVQMFLWASLLIISAMFLHALEPLAVNAKGITRLWKGVGVIALVAGFALLLGALGGSRDLLQPLRVYKGGEAGTAETTTHLAFQRVKNLTELDAAVRGAAGRQVMLDFYADWCVSCKEMERFTFADPKVQAQLKDVLLLQADVTANSTDDKALLARFKLFGPPGMIFFDQAGGEIAYRVVGYEPPEKFLGSLGQVLGSAPGVSHGASGQ